MPSQENDEKVNKLFDEYLNEISSDESAEDYLKSEGLNPDDLVNDGIRKIKQFRMKMASAKTESSYSALALALTAKAKEEVQRIMDAASFDFGSFVKKEGITLAYRNFESMTKDEIRELLEKHILLKLQKQKDNEQNGK
ncbi:MAG TPA: hypothetical protein VEB86_18050 [Chryseosolibacter sp.]|nr:hypothetical protein [Chryseosolibacter sp.]